MAHRPPIHDTWWHHKVTTYIQKRLSKISYYYGFLNKKLGEQSVYNCGAGQFHNISFLWFEGQVNVPSNLLSRKKLFGDFLIH